GSPAISASRSARRPGRRRRRRPTSRSCWSTPTRPRRRQQPRPGSSARTASRSASRTASGTWRRWPPPSARGASPAGSATPAGPGHVTHTHAGPTPLGELDGRRTPRLERLDQALTKAGFASSIEDDIVGLIWGKFVHNCAINALSAVTGLRVGEIVRSPGADQFQTKLIEECLAVIAAKGIRLPEHDPMADIKAFCQTKFNKPSMLQHVEQGKRTEVDALNGAVVREGRALGIPTPFNEALTWLTQASEQQMQRRLHEPLVDYARLEAEAKAAAKH